MSKPRLYGISGSRALRSIWAAEEVGLDYEQVATHFFNDSKTDEYLAVNPNGRIPALVDGDVTLFESMAINLYLAKKYGAAALYPSDAVSEAQIWQWSVWAISEIEPLQMQIVIQKLFMKPEQRDQAVIDGATENLQRPLKVLDAHLADRDYLLGAEFTIADLNLAGVMNLLGMIEFDYSNHANVSAWAQRCYARPSLAAAQARD